MVPVHLQSVARKLSNYRCWSELYFLLVNESKKSRFFGTDSNLDLLIFQHFKQEERKYQDRLELNWTKSHSFEWIYPKCKYYFLLSSIISERKYQDFLEICWTERKGEPLGGSTFSVQENYSKSSVSFYGNY